MDFNKLGKFLYLFFPINHKTAGIAPRHPCFYAFIVLCTGLFFALTRACSRRSSLYGAVNRKLSRPFCTSNSLQAISASSSTIRQLSGCSVVNWVSRFRKSVFCVRTRMTGSASLNHIVVSFCAFFSPVFKSTVLS